MKRLEVIWGSALAVALVTAIKELVLWILNRRAKVKDADKTEEDENTKLLHELCEAVNNLSTGQAELIEHLSKLDVQSANYAESIRLILKDRIKFIAFSYIREGKISYDDRKALHDMWSVYHYKLDGNGDLNTVMAAIDNLQLDLEED